MPSRALALLLLASCGTAPVPARRTPQPEPEPAAPGAPEDEAPLGRLPSDVRPLRYGLDLTIVPDLERFAGEVRVEVDLDRARSVVWMHGLDLRITDASIEEGDERVPATWTTVPDSEGVGGLRPERPVGPGRATIRIAWDAAFDRNLQGLYRVDDAGESYAFTQFEAISARRAFPCFDEPAFKTPFDIALTVRADHVAIANTLQRSEERAPEGMRRVRFATTEKLPTYLLAFAVGRLDVVAAPDLPANDVRSRPLPFRGIAAKGRGQRLAYALAHTGPILAALERYFGIAYPYDKLDILAVPDFASGAMENAGAVTFREPLLLLDDASPEDQKRAYANVMAHELAHMWFGDLVTMPWWDDIWLNEAFATWMGHRVVETVHPDYRAGVQLLERVQGAMGSDSLVSARRIRQPIDTHHDIRNAFDGITYSKGAGVLGMFERWIGAETFRRGLSAYMAKHRFGSATADDLLAALSEAAGRDVATPFRTFLDQAGLPMIEATPSCENGSARIALKQSRYLPVGSSGDRAMTWRLPVCARSAVRGEALESCTLLEAAEGSIALPTEGRCPDWVIPNADGAGYFRWSLPPSDLAKIRRAFGKLTPRERLSFADSLGGAFGAATLPAADVYRALEPLARDETRAVATAPMGLVRFARERIADEAMRPRVEAFARRLYAPVLRRLRWDARPGEDGETKLLRADVIEFLAHVGRDPAVRREATRRGRAFLGIGGDGRIHPDAAPPEMHDVVLAVAVQEGDAAAWDAVLAHVRPDTDASLRSKLISALGSTHDPALAERARALALDARLRVNETMGPIGAQMGELEMRQQTWEWMKSHFDALVERLSTRGSGWLPWMAASFCDDAHGAEAREFFAPRVAALPGAPRNLAGATEAIGLCAARVAAHRESATTFFRR